MGALMRERDWSNSPAGSPDDWPQSLRSVISLMLNSRYPMFIAWGPELAFLYNDGYRPIFGAKHPHALGQPFAEVWSEIWSDIKPLVDRALAGDVKRHPELTPWRHEELTPPGGCVQGLFPGSTVDGRSLVPTCPFHPAGGA